MNMGHDPGWPNPTSIDKLKQTEFVPTLENNIADRKNVIYCPTLLYAWDIVKESFKDSITLKDSNSIDFKLLNQSTSSHNTLNNDENLSEASFSDTTITVRSFFNKELPFPSKFQKLDDGVLFGKTKVRAFGMKDFDRNIIDFTQIVFYKDDDHFVIKTLPDTLNEIILVKGLKNIQSLADGVKQTGLLIKNGGNEKLNQKNAWKYTFNADDDLSIPVVKFDIEAHYKNIEGQEFLHARKKYTIEVAYQKTALTLDENGGHVESEADISYASDSVAVPEKMHPKHLVFNEPFYIIIRHINRNPYFVMRVENAELLKKM